MKVAMVGLLVGILGVIPLAFAANWQLASRDENTEYYFDKSSIKQQGSMRIVWELETFKIPRTAGGQQYYSSKSLNEYDCKNDRSRITYIAAYSAELGNGSALFSAAPNLGWKPIVPESIGETMYRSICDA